MKQVMTTLILSLLLISTGFCQESEDEKKRIVQLLDDAFSKKEVVGVASGVINIDGKTWYHQAGYANRDSKTPFSIHTVSRIASTSKPITAVAIMQLVEQGKLTLNTKVGSILPEFNNGQKAKITVQHLMQHSSGIPHYKNKKEINNEKEYPNLSDVLSIYIDRELLFEPGTKFTYSVYGYVTLGIIIEKISGISYTDYLTENIFKKAGMKNSSIEEFGQNYPNKSKLYHKHSKRKTIEITNQNLSDRVPAGGIQTTVEDLLLFGKSLLNHTLVSKESMELLLTDSGLEVKPNNPYGMGFRLYGTGEKMGRIVGHNGQQLGCSAFLFLFPDRGIASAVISNTSVYNATGNIGISLFTVGEGWSKSE